MSQEHADANLIGKFSNDQQGGFVTIIALALTTIIVMAMFAIDYAKLTLVRMQAQQAADIAVISSLPDLHSPNYQDVAMRFFTANFADNYLSTDYKSDDVVIMRETAVNRISVDPQFRTETILGRYQGTGAQDMRVHSTGQHTTDNPNLEVTLVIDNTGSLCHPDCTWFDAMVDSAKGFTSSLYDGQQTLENTSISIVPFVAAVNVGNGPTQQSWLTNGADTITDMVIAGDYDNHPDKDGQPWMGCVEARADLASVDYPGTTMDMTDETPSMGSFGVYYDEGDSFGNPWNGQASTPNGRVTSSAPMEVSEDMGTYSDAVMSQRVYMAGPNKSCPAPMQTFLTDYNDVVSAIETSRSIDGGGTMVNVGMAWAWRTLSPKWQGVWDAAKTDLPRPYDASNRKIVVLFTDGDNQFFPSDLQSIYPKGSQYTAFKRFNENKLDITGTHAEAREELDRRLLETCAMMKAENITIYTVLARYAENSDYAALLRQCASGTDFSYTVNDTAEMATAFREIAEEIARSSGFKGAQIVR